MKDKVIHQWRDWVLEFIDVGNYLLVHKKNRDVTRSVIAKTDMDAENQCQVIIRGWKAAEGSVESDADTIPTT